MSLLQQTGSNPAAGEVLGMLSPRYFEAETTSSAMPPMCRGMGGGVTFLEVHDQLLGLLHIEAKIAICTSPPDLYLLFVLLLMVVHDTSHFRCFAHKIHYMTPV